MSRVVLTPALLLYSPLGLILVFIRSLLLIYVFLASVILYTVPPIKRLLLRSMCSILGFIVTSEGTPSCSREQPLVSNCVTLFDHMALNLLTNSVTPYKFMLSWALTWRHLNYEESDYKSKISDVFHLQPEETPTGTQTKIILKFNAAPFKIFNKVQPVAITVSRYLPINLSVHPIDWKYEIFWVLFSPVIRVHVKFLTPVSRCIDSDQTIGEFVDIVRNNIAKAVDAQLIDLDKNNFLLLSGESAPVIEVPKVQRKDKIENQNNCPTQISTKHKIIVDKSECSESNNCNLVDSSSNNNISKDARLGQVIAVLPNVNCNDVKKLLDEMGDVDSVIARLLEQSDCNNKMTTIPANISTILTNTTSNTTTTTSNTTNSTATITSKHVAPSCHKIAASSFSRNPEDRHKSFAERKMAFLENARLRYMELHHVN